MEPSMSGFSASADIRTYAALRLAGLITAYIIVGCRHTHKSIPRYGKSIVLLPHIASGLIETFRFAVLDLWSPPSSPGFLDMGLCLVQSLTNGLLAWNLEMGIPTYTRPSYLSGAILRPLLSISAYFLSNPDLHLTSIYLLDGFIYTRLLILILRRAVPAYRVRYATAVPGAAMIAAATAGWRCGGSGEMVNSGQWRGALKAMASYAVLTVFLIGIRAWWRGPEPRSKDVKRGPREHVMEKPNEWQGGDETPRLSRSDSTTSEAESQLDTPPDLDSGLIGNPFDVVAGGNATTKGGLAGCRLED